MPETNNLNSSIQNVSGRELRDLVRTQLQIFLEAGELQGAKTIFGLQIIGQKAMSDDKPKKRLCRGIIGRNVK
ncbi:hypothetical protein [Nostoc sp.]|uniref:hypothetical protein n=1 Tax=Nostoc sp. TaxID=1180 RepID=UPI002FF7CF15